VTTLTPPKVGVADLEDDHPSPKSLKHTEMNTRAATTIVPSGIGVDASTTEQAVLDTLLRLVVPVVTSHRYPTCQCLSS
jgi:hypothetical protein